MMDEVDLRQTDPRRNGLEQDRIILEFAINQLRTILVENPGTATSFDQGAARQNDFLLTQVYSYKADQFRLLQRVIAVYEENYLMLLKEDSL